MKKLLLGVLLSFSVQAASDEDVFIRGKIASTFNEREVHVIDSFNQSYTIPTKYFPKDFKFKQGAAFGIEVPESEVSRFKMKKK